MRNFNDWLLSYVEYASFSEAPRRMHFFAGVSAIAGALRRRTWIDMAYFKWFANHYIVFVAPPGIVSKSTTVSIAMDLLRRVPGINFGPDVVTWPALVTAFAAAGEQYEIQGEYHTQCALTLESSEFGNLVNPADRDMIDLLVTLWDSRTGAFKKVTKGSGNDTVENPWINLVACTTPAWIAGNFPEYVIGGGFTSRCLFIYTDKKDKLVAYPHLSVPPGLHDTAQKLAVDLEHISTALAGPYILTPEALAWGEVWYSKHYSKPPDGLEDDRFGGYLARKQTHIHKLAMVLAASCRDELIITDEDLALANTMITELEAEMPKVFARIGKTEAGVQAERFINIIRAKGAVPYSEAYRMVHSHFPDMRSFEGVLKGAINAGFLEIDMSKQPFMIRAKL
ncbi:MAG: hypothetical protein ACREBW_05760 [Candidatus Micrarchaeaceae archaeon]